MDGFRELDRKEVNLGGSNIDLHKGQVTCPSFTQVSRHALWKTWLQVMSSLTSSSSSMESRQIEHPFTDWPHFRRRQRR
ncbi:hypothetical protein H5410_008519 [Solanum commersonii]|uniref:Uncharacterized protein n=1 Tax=Solanum commersonii TaxID=4109 RepID=A0A9J6AF70_SOLCO|nr:hypothetical protein H5410_008519 [Solanum commersonii]